MNLVDSSGWIELIRGGKNASVFSPILKKPAELVVPTVTITEVCRHLFRWSGTTVAELAASRMREGLVVDLDGRIAWEAARLGVDLKLPVADSIVLATARAYNATLWTQDADFEGFPGVKYVPKR